VSACPNSPDLASLGFPHPKADVRAVVLGHVGQFRMGVDSVTLPGCALVTSSLSARFFVALELPS
jgi:hypothetical protein